MLSGSRLVIIDLGFSDHPRYEKASIYYNVGSPAYMSPEAYYEGIYSHKSDIWALGIILHEMLLGKTLSEAGTYEQMISVIAKGEFGVKGKSR